MAPTTLPYSLYVAHNRLLLVFCKECSQAFWVRKRLDQHVDVLLVPLGVVLQNLRDDPVLLTPNPGTSKGGAGNMERAVANGEATRVEPRKGASRDCHDSRMLISCSRNGWHVGVKARKKHIQPPEVAVTCVAVFLSLQSIHHNRGAG